MQRLKRVIACIEDPPLIAKILWHIQQRAEMDGPDSGGSAEARVASAVRNKPPILVGMSEKVVNNSLYGPCWHRGQGHPV
jgi:hypothetical protein